MDKVRVVVSGIGILSPLGCNMHDTWSNLIAANCSGISNITAFDTSGFTAKIAGEIKCFDESSYIDKKHSTKMSRYLKFAVSAASMAYEDAKLNNDNIDRNSIGVYVGTGIGGMDIMEQQDRVLIEKGNRRVSPFFIPYVIPNMAAGIVSIALGLNGPSKGITTACASGAHAIGDAFETIKNGKAKIMLCGAAEAPITPLIVSGFSALKALTTKYNDEPARASRPFSLSRDGFVMSEGAAILVLEELDHARNRNANIYAEIIGYAATSDAYHITDIEPTGTQITRAIKLALDSAAVNRLEVDYINAHGTSTQKNDKVETRAIKELFGTAAYKIPISSVKGALGHSLAAAGAIEAAVTCLAINNDVIPPTFNYDGLDIDPECDLNYVPNQALYKKVNIAITNSFGFGGQNAVLVLKKFVDH